MSVRVLSAGLLATVQDLGRTGYASIGVGTAGAMDPVALRLANLLVGNAPGSAAIEITLRGPRLRFEVATLIALTGAEIDARCEGIVVPGWRPVLLRAGSELLLGGVRRGARTYLAVAGGFRLPTVLGSCSTDLNAGIGPIARPLAADDALPCLPAPRDMCRELWAALGPHASGKPGFAAAAYSLDPAPWFDAHAGHALRLIPGTHFGLLDPPSQRALFEREFRIGVDSNRVGLRLEGAPLQLARPHESISEGAMPGTLQLPPGGVPIALVAEAPTTGGYPRIGHVASVDQPRLAQHRPGDVARFTRCDPAEAQMRYLERERALDRLARNISERLYG